MMLRAHPTPEMGHPRQAYAGPDLSDTERHLLGDYSDKMPLLGRGARRVAVAVSEQAAGDPEVQMALWMTCNLLCRLKGVVGELDVCVPKDAGVVEACRGWRASGSDGLGDALSDSLDLWARGCRVRCTEGDAEARPDACVLLGHDAQYGGKAAYEVHASCSGWLAYVWHGAAAPPAAAPGPPRGMPNPFGAAAAACLSAGEVFKRLCGMRPDAGRFAASLCYSTYDLRARDPCGTRIENPSLPAGVDLGRIAVCGAGAVAHSFCQSIGSMQGLRGDLLLIDRREGEGQKSEAIDGTNLARYLLATGSDVGRPKAEVLCERVRHMGRLRAEHDDGGLEALADRGDLRDMELAVSCVDNNGARHVIQEQLPRIILGGSVDGLRSQVSLYDLQRGTACLKCRNPVEGPASDDEVDGIIRGMGKDARRRAAAGAGVDPESLESHLESHSCGSLEPELLRRMVPQAPPDFTANFATAFSGAMLAAEAVKARCRSLKPALDGDLNADMFYVFWTGWSKLHPTRPRQGCWCVAGKKTPRDIHKKVWGRRG